MPDHTLFPATVVTPEGVVFEGEVQEIDLTSVAGELGVLARRAPIVADLKLGRVTVHLEDGSRRTWATAEGFAQASDSTATVVVEDALAVDEITDARIDQLAGDAQATIDAAERGDDVPEGQVASARKSLIWAEHLRTMREAHGAS